MLARYHGTDAPRSMEFAKKAEISGASIAQALEFLETHDFVFKNKNNFYVVLDPLIKAILSEDSP